MEKITAQDPESQTADLLQQNIDQLRALFPQCVTEGGLIDFETLKDLLSDNLDDKAQGRYYFDWAGKNLARREANKPSTATLRPDKDNSKDWDQTQNIFIEGDNLEVLKLLQKSYNSKVKMIYIDPPYNTGKDFVYPDNYADNLQNYLRLTGQVDGEGLKTSTNTDRSGRFHSNWLNMMYPRLVLARNLMTDDGVIFISIDDNEVHNLRKICDEVFGEENFVGGLIQQRAKGGGKAKHIVKGHDYCVVYGRDLEKIYPLLIPREGSKISRSKVETIDGVEYFIDDDVVRKVFGKYTKGEERRCFYEDLSIYKSESQIIDINAKLKSGDFFLRKWAGGKHVICQKKELTSIAQKVYSILKYLSEKGTEELVNLGIDFFESPKPVDFVKILIQSCTNGNEIILDFFAGSGTTAQAVMQLNADDDGNRSYICVQLPEATPADSEARIAKYDTISAITRERIRRAGDKIKAEQQAKDGMLLNEGEAPVLDIGFRAYRLAATNVIPWDPNPAAFQKDTLFDDVLKQERTEDDILHEVLLKLGLVLTQPALTRKITIQDPSATKTQQAVEATVYCIGDGVLFGCFSRYINSDVIDLILAWHRELKPLLSQAVLRDAGFRTDEAKTNAVMVLKEAGMHKVRSI